MEKQICDIIDYGYNGEGIAKTNGKVFFVPKTLKGEKISCETTKESSRHAFAKLDHVIEPSNKRCPSACPYFDKCGGCNFQHTDYAHEIEIKKELFLREFQKYEKLKDVDIVTSAPAEYRNKIRFKVKDKSLGFFEEKTNSFVKVDKCLLASTNINNAISKINSFLQNSNHTFEEVVVLDFDGELCFDFLTKDNVSRQDFPFDNLMINHKGDVIQYTCNGIDCFFEGDAFRQVNDEIASKIYDEVVNEVQGQIVANAYSGAGLLSSLLTKKAQKVYGIELNKNAHKSAEKLKKHNNLYNLENICGYAEQELGKLGKLDCVVLDPPRAGCDKKGLLAIIQNKIEKIIYVSCNPATLVRDLNILKNAYFLERVKLFDMFPRTANIETFVILARKDLTKGVIKE